MSDEEQRVEALLELRRWADAVAATDRQLAADPADWRAWCLRSRALLGAERTDEALAAADRAAGLRPDDEHPQRLRAIALGRQGHRRRALDAAERCVALAPDLMFAQSVLAQAQSAAKQHDAAEATARRIVATAPNWAHGWEVLGEVLLRRRRSKESRAEAIEAFRAALRIEPTSASAMNGLGAALLANKRRDEASDHFARAARADPHNTAARSNLELVTRVGGGFLFFLAFRIAVDAADGWAARVTVATVMLSAGIAILLAVREQRTRALPADAERFVRAQRRERRRHAGDPRTWWRTIARQPKRSLFVGGFAALVVAYILFAPSRASRNADRDRDEPSLDELCASPLWEDQPALRPSMCPPP